MHLVFVKQLSFHGPETAQQSEIKFLTCSQMWANLIHGVVGKFALIKKKDKLVSKFLNFPNRERVKYLLNKCFNTFEFLYLWTNN